MQAKGMVMREEPELVSGPVSDAMNIEDQEEQEIK